MTVGAAQGKGEGEEMILDLFSGRRGLGVLLLSRTGGHRKEETVTAGPGHPEGGGP